ncbi:MAG: hypothetical protein DRO39_01980 [Thermoprotei archaeon]|nr:MAG: hypothetical protein DRO39_01980 [Thermoprotei archaeon]
MTPEELRRAVERALREYPYAYPDIIHVTDACNPCLRQAYYKRVYGSIKRPAMIEGSRVHEELLDRLAYELNCTEEISTVYYYQYGGSLIAIEGVADLLCDGYIVELKTSRRGYIKDSWVMQLNAYMKMFNVDKGFIVLIHGDRESRIEVREYQFSGELWDDFLDRVIRLHIALKNQEPPVERNEKLCPYCEYKNLCRPEKRLA